MSSNLLSSFKSSLRKIEAKDENVQRTFELKNSVLGLLTLYAFAYNSSNGTSATIDEILQVLIKDTIEADKPFWRTLTASGITVGSHEFFELVEQVTASDEASASNHGDKEKKTRKRRTAAEIKADNEANSSGNSNTDDSAGSVAVAAAENSSLESNISVEDKQRTDDQVATHSESEAEVAATLTSDPDQVAEQPESDKKTQNPFQAKQGNRFGRGN